eukprot:TRINITY_DN7293_c0_g1_i1.p1 TRINITY_DN7293_c0_g1~~TRINITY_DN7293_c0_g1_i1.p1  ORF type:complete len:637 (-),score=135.16 TRINITY_DN7293_c0_g1_i1:2235-4145(-)
MPPRFILATVFGSVMGFPVYIRLQNTAHRLRVRTGGASESFVQFRDRLRQEFAQTFNLAASVLDRCSVILDETEAAFSALAKVEEELKEGGEYLFATKDAAIATSATVRFEATPNEDAEQVKIGDAVISASRFPRKRVRSDPTPASPPKRAAVCVEEDWSRDPPRTRSSTGSTPVKIKTEKPVAKPVKATPPATPRQSTPKEQAVKKSPAVKSPAVKSPAVKSPSAAAVRATTPKPSPSTPKAASVKTEPQRKKEPASSDSKKPAEKIPAPIYVAADLSIDVGDNFLAEYRDKLIYYGRILEIKKGKKERKYFMHFQGWSERYDDWVPHSKLLKFTPQNLTRQRLLLAGANRGKNFDRQERQRMTRLKNLDKRNLAKAATKRAHARVSAQAKQQTAAKQGKQAASTLTKAASAITKAAAGTAAGQASRKRSRSEAGNSSSNSRQKVAPESADFDSIPTPRQAAAAAAAEAALQRRQEHEQWRQQKGRAKSVQPTSATNPSAASSDAPATPSTPLVQRKSATTAKTPPSSAGTTTVAYISAPPLPATPGSKTSTGLTPQQYRSPIGSPEARQLFGPQRALAALSRHDGGAASVPPVLMMMGSPTQRTVTASTTGGGRMPINSPVSPNSTIVLTSTRV